MKILLSIQKENKQRRTHMADMETLAIEEVIGEFTGGDKPMFVRTSQQKINKDAYVPNEELYRTIQLGKRSQDKANGRGSVTTRCRRKELTH